MSSRVPWGMGEPEACAQAAHSSSAARNARAREKRRLDWHPLISFPGGRLQPALLLSDGIYDSLVSSIVSSGRYIAVCHSDGTTVMTVNRRHPRVWEELGKMCRAINSRVDQTFLIEVFFISVAQMFLQAVHHGHLPPKFRSNTSVTKGVSCPKKSIRSIKSSTVP